MTNYIGSIGLIVGGNEMGKIPFYPHTDNASAKFRSLQGSQWVAVLGLIVLAGILFHARFHVSAQGAGPERIIRGTVRILREFFDQPRFLVVSHYKNNGQSCRAVMPIFPDVTQYYLIT